MKKLATHTLGCRLNQFETERIAAGFYPSGFERTAFSEAADLYLINTCTVTHKADATCRQMISNVARRKGAGKLVVIGCYVESDRRTVVDLPGVDLVISNREKSQTQELIRQHWPELFGEAPTGHSCRVSDFHDHSRAWLKISDGCNQRCTFCIIPTVRGALRNNRADRVIADINQFVEAGYQEVVFTGVHIGHFKDPQRGVKSLSDLLRMVLVETDLPRLRLSSLEPQVVNEEIIDLMQSNVRRVCRYLHLPLQSGADRTLERMRRPYNRERYLEVVRSLKETIPGIGLGADVIVGFPGETDDDFSQTLQIADSGYLDYLHVFTYSDRAGTVASSLPEKVDPRIVAKRHRQLRQISLKRRQEQVLREVGNTVSVISENFSESHGRYWGVTDNYIKTLLPEGVGGDRNIHRLRSLVSAEDYLNTEKLASGAKYKVNDEFQSSVVGKLQ